jgi:hypothetical protein
MSHGCLLNPDGSVTQIDPPGSVGTTPYGVNDIGQIVGQYRVQAEDGSSSLHSFLAVPEEIPEPASLTLLGSGILILGSFRMMRRRKTRWHRAIEGAASRHIAG